MKAFFHKHRRAEEDCAAGVDPASLHFGVHLEKMLIMPTLKRRTDMDERFIRWLVFTILLFLLAGWTWGCSGSKQILITDGSLKQIQLPNPQTTGGKPLMEALRDRKSGRDYSPRPLESQTLSNLLWAAFGINRPESGKRTAPSALNWQETDIYVFTDKGVYLYDAGENVLQPVAVGDHRGKTGSIIQPFVKKAPVNLVFIVDAARTGFMGKMISREDRDMFSDTAVGFISQNVYLFCASEGLSTVVRGLIDREAVKELLKLRPEQRIILAQSIGYPADKD
jgi:nitroreductase